MKRILVVFMMMFTMFGAQAQAQNGPTIAEQLEALKIVRNACVGVGVVTGAVTLGSVAVATGNVPVAVALGSLMITAGGTFFTVSSVACVITIQGEINKLELRTRYIPDALKQYF